MGRAIRVERSINLTKAARRLKGLIEQFRQRRVALAKRGQDETLPLTPGTGATSKGLERLQPVPKGVRRLLGETGTQ